MCDMTYTYVYNTFVYLSTSLIIILNRYDINAVGMLIPIGLDIRIITYILCIYIYSLP